MVNFCLEERLPALPLSPLTSTSRAPLIQVGDLGSAVSSPCGVRFSDQSRIYSMAMHHCDGVYPLRSFYYQGPKWMSSSVLFLVRSLSTSVLSTDLDIHFGPLSLRSFASSVLFTDLTWKTKMQAAGRCS